MAQAESNAQIIEEAKKASEKNPAEAEKLYRKILAEQPSTSEAASRDYETALLGLGELYKTHSKQQELAELVKTSRQTLSSFAKAKTAKLGRSSICYFCSLANKF